MSIYEEWAKIYRSDKRTDEELLTLAIQHAGDIDASDDLFWKPVTVLQHRLVDLFPVICLYAKSSNLCERNVAATVLGQNSVKEKVLCSKCAAVLCEMLICEQQVAVLTSILYALGHLKEISAIDSILPFVSHENSDVRHAVTSALGGLENPRAIQALIVLSRDTDRDVRNWATFNLGSLIANDSTEIREALVDRLAETDSEIREEAIVGLVERADPRAINAMLKEIELWSESRTGMPPLVEQAIDSLLCKSNDLNEDWKPLLEKINELNLGGDR